MRPTRDVRKAKRRWLEAGFTIAQLAKKIGRHQSTVSEHLSCRYKVGPQVRSMLESVFERYDIETEGMWEPDPDFQTWFDSRWELPADDDDDDTPTDAPTDTPNDEEDETLLTPTRETLTYDVLSHFKLTVDPFEDLPVERSWTSPVRQFLRRKIERAILSRSIIAINGEVGSGKTTMLRQLLVELNPNAVAVCSPAAINRNRLTEASIALSMLRDLNKGEIHYSMSAEQRSQALRELLGQFREANKIPLLVIDEAHDLSNDALVALKRIWDSYTTYRLLSVVMLGQLSLGERLKRDLKLRELAGRTTVLELPEMSSEEAYDYVHHRFSVAGQNVTKVFAEDAFEGVRAGTRMYPLWLNTLAVRAMVAAFDRGESLVTRDHIARV